LAEFERTGISKNFPTPWEIGRKMAIEFCNNTRRSLDKLMVKRRAEIDWKLLSHAINHTILFENLLSKRFPAKDGFSFDKIIWEVFDTRMDIFLAAQKKNLDQFLNDCSNRIRSGEERPLREVNTTAIPLPSSANLFLLLKKIITETSKLFANSDAILCKLVEMFQHCLRDYGHGCLSAFLPQLSTGSSIGLLQSLMREEANNPRLSSDKQFFTCCLLATADWCAETTLQLQEKIKQRINNVDLNQEIELFYNISNNALTTIVQDIEAACDSNLQAMTKINWALVESVGDESLYVVSIRKHLRESVPQIREYFADRRKYFAHFCLKLASQLVNKFLGALFRCKPVSQTGAEQLLLDTHALKTFLLNMPSIESFVVTKPPTTYTNMLVKGMNKAEMILKAVMADISNPEEYVSHYIRTLPDSDSNELQKVLEMRSVRRSDQMQIIQLYRSRSEGQHSESTDTTSAASTFNLFDSIGESSSLRKLEKLVKRRM